MTEKDEPIGGEKEKGKVGEYKHWEIFGFWCSIVKIDFFVLNLK